MERTIIPEITQNLVRSPIYTTSETVQVRCCKCGKPITKTVSIQYQHSMEAEDWELLEQGKQTLLAEEHICSNCLKLGCKANPNHIDKTKYTKTLEDMTKTLEEITQLQTKLDTLAQDFGEDLIGKVIVHNNNEYVVKRVRGGSNHGNEFEMECAKIHKSLPYYTTMGGSIVVSLKGRGYKNNALWSSILVTDEVFKERIERKKDYDSANR